MLQAGYSQSEQAYGQLRRMLCLQRIPEGQRLSELEWTRRLGVNRNALREAMARLETEGLLVKRRGKGYAVPSTTPEDLEEVREVRVLLETEAVRRICRLGLNTPESLRRLEAACAQFETLCDAGYYYAVLEADFRFHETLIGAAGNRRLIMLYRGVPSQSLGTAILADGVANVGSPGHAADHRCLVDAVRNVNFAVAQAVIRRHIIGTKQSETAPSVQQKPV